MSVFPLLRIRILLISLFFVAGLPAQKQEIKFERISIEEGLTQSSVFITVQDKEGFIWFGTEEGLNKFDGYQFKTFYRKNYIDSTSLTDSWINWMSFDHGDELWIGTSSGGLNRLDLRSETFKHYRYQPQDTTSLSSDRILTVYTDSKNNVWVGTDGGGLNKFDRSRNCFIHFLHNSGNRNSLSHNNIITILEDRSGFLWLGTDGGGLDRFDPVTRSFTHFVHDPRNSRSISNNVIYALEQDQSGKIWVGTGNGLNEFDPGQGIFRRFYHDPADDHSISNNYVRSLSEDRNGNLWIGTNGAGLNRYNPDNNDFAVFTNNPSNPKSLSNNNVWNIFEDRSGTIWVGTNSGVNKFSRARFLHYKNNPVDPGSLSNNFLWSIYEDRSGGIWIGTNGGGLEYFDRTKERFIHHRPDPENSNSIGGDRILSILEDSEGYFWLGLYGAGLDRYDLDKKKYIHFRCNNQDNSSLPHDNVWALLEDSSGRIWIGTDDGLCVYDKSKRTFGRIQDQLSTPHTLTGIRIRVLYKDTRGMIWIGTYGGGLNRFDPLTNSSTLYQHDPVSAGSLSNNRVSSIYEDAQGTMWIGTAGGLNKLLPGQDKFVVYTDEQGLPNNVIYGILGDKEGNLWMSTNKGLSRFNPQTGIFLNYDVHDGLQSNEFNAGAYRKSKNGEMFFGGVNGFNIFDPEQIKVDAFIPPIHLTSFKKFDKPVRFPITLTRMNEIRLACTENYFSFEFAALDYTNPRKNQYAYKLEGFDLDWVVCGNRRYASYTNLDAGRYTFQVRGSNSDGVWNNKGTSVRITIIPPFWKTIWFRIFISITGLGLVYGIYKKRVRNIKKQKNILEQQVAERTAQIEERTLLLRKKTTELQRKTIELRQTNSQLRVAKSETDNILNNVQEGFFLLNVEFEIGSQYSKALETIFNQKKLAQKNLLEFLNQKIPSHTIPEVVDYLELMFDTNIDESSMSELNPLTRIELVFNARADNQPVRKFLSFEFRRIKFKDRISGLIVTVNDITEQVELSRRLEKSEAKTREQVEWLTSILHIEAPLLQEFMDGANTELELIEQLSAHLNHDGNGLPVLDKLYRSVHLVKGNASLLDLPFFAKQAHRVEDRISEIKKKAEFKKRDLTILESEIKEMRRILTELQELIGRISKIHSHFRPRRSYENQLLLKSIRNLIANLANELNKKVKFNCTNFNADQIPYPYRLLVKDILVQLVRNAMIHGIEQVEERTSSHKVETGTIELSTGLDLGIFQICFRDDGRGLQIEKLRRQAMISGKWDPREIEKWDEHLVVSLIFEPGITTTETADLNAGRGMGMDIVRHKVEGHGGTIQVKYASGQFCEFIIQLPVAAEKENTRNGEKKPGVC